MMAVSKRLRYEVIRRDGHACRYCGQAAPDVKLTVDHVVPVALGGGDEPENLVTACAICNAGKSSSAPDAPLVSDVAQDAIRWGRAMRLAADAQAAERQARDRYAAEFLDAWNDWGYGPEENRRLMPLPDDWTISVERFRQAGLEVAVLGEFIDQAARAQYVVIDRKFRYVCGCAWNVITERQQIARELLEAGEAE